MKVTDDQFRFEWYSGTGKGGQHRNKHQNCCRCIHEPTGITANGTESRSREDNKRAALEVCKARIAAKFHQDKERFLAGNERVRTYNEADNRVYDHASGEQFSWDGVMVKGEFDAVIDLRSKAVR